jgi:hypothetical protein
MKIICHFKISTFYDPIFSKFLVNAKLLIATNHTTFRVFQKFQISENLNALFYYFNSSAIEIVCMA